MGVYIGIDVGTGSARAGVFDGRGKMLGSGSHPIQTWLSPGDFVEQSSENIWRACGIAVRKALRQSGQRAAQVRGIGFDATCSLVAVDARGRPVTVSPSGKGERNVIVWMDHRAVEQARRINALRHGVLKYVGGTISPEMESPKLLWLKENLPRSWRRARRFFDLPDYLTFRATGDETRSLCSTVCKWTYLGHEKSSGAKNVGRWDDSYWKQIGLGDLVEEEYERIGRKVRPMGEPLGSGLTRQAARELGLAPGTAVGVSIIDAHAGGLGVLGSRLCATGSDRAPAPPVAASVPGGNTGTQINSPLATKPELCLALICGTSTCHMAVSRKPAFVPGVWGPYFSAMIPGLWLTEGGQSATGALIDHVIFSHACASQLQREASASGRTVYELLNVELDALARSQRVNFPAQLTRELHLLPYFHGNRSPRADPSLRGLVSGLKLSASVSDLALLYLAAIQSIAHGTRHIIEALNAHGYRIKTIFACGGGTKNPVFLREHADITGCRIVLPREPEAVLLGAGVLGAAASGGYASVLAAMSAMNHAGKVVAPATGAVARYHRAKHAVFRRMYEHQMEYRELMRKQ